MASTSAESLSSAKKPAKTSGFGGGFRGSSARGRLTGEEVGGKRMGDDGASILGVYSKVLSTIDIGMSMARGVGRGGIIPGVESPSRGGEQDALSWAACVRDASQLNKLSGGMARACAPMQQRPNAERAVLGTEMKTLFWPFSLDMPPPKCLAGQRRTESFETLGSKTNHNFSMMAMPRP